MDPIRSIPNTTFYVDTVRKNWDDCRSAAANNGFAFASIQNERENDAVADYLQSNSIWVVWLGGYQTSFDDEPAGNWAWLDGTPWTDSTYTNWYVDDYYFDGEWNQPDNGYYNDQHHLYQRSWRDGTWADGNKDWRYPCLFRDPT